MCRTSTHKGDAVVVTDAAAVIAETQRTDAFASRYRYRMHIAIEGRIRFLSHLETVDTLLSAMRRAGVHLAMSQGMKPKPLIKVAMPRPVAVAAWSDIVDIEMATEVDPNEIAMKLVDRLPVGITLTAVTRVVDGQRSAASRVAGATFRIAFAQSSDALPSQLAAAVAAFNTSETCPIERRSPKQRRTVDVRRFVTNITQPDETVPTVRYFASLSDEGSVKPDEIVRALREISGLDESELRVASVIRESIALAQPGEDGVVADSTLVGADVPDGPARPWGSC